MNWHKKKDFMYSECSSKDGINVEVPFDNLANDTEQMIGDIEASAKMNHIKVNDLSNNNHKYSQKNFLKVFLLKKIRMKPVQI